MKQFTLNLVKQMQRPIVVLKNWHGILALLDTGAVFPVWTKNESILTELGGTYQKGDIWFSGFGGATKGNLFILPSLTVGDLIFSNIPVIASKDLENLPFQLILSATMFSGLIYEIDDYNHRLNVTIPAGESTVRNMRIVDSNGRLHILCNSNDEISGSVKQEKETDSGLELLNHIDKLHSTELGIARIKKNLSLDTDDVVAWCKDKISSAHAIIERRGKNWYVNADNFVITVNAHSYTIITAHSKKISNI